MDKSPNGTKLDLDHSVANGDGEDGESNSRLAKVSRTRVNSVRPRRLV